MKTFHHGGRIGDCIYALYTVWWMWEHWRADDVTFFLSDFHQGNWSEKDRQALLPLIEHQIYIKEAKAVSYDSVDGVDYDLRRAEDDFNPEVFPEWTGPNWPGNCHLAKRYSQHFGIKFEPESVWLTAPQTKKVDVVIHAPEHRVTNRYALSTAVELLLSKGVNVVGIGSNKDLQYYRNFITKGGLFIEPTDLLEAADWINSAKVFIGAVSGPACIAEGLKKRRLLQIADDCDNTFHSGKTGKCINSWTGDQIANIAEMMIKNG